MTQVINNNCKSLGGSFSAEHGVGRLKVKDLKQYCDPGKFNVMRQIKKAIDPFTILNPGVILRQDNQDIKLKINESSHNNLRLLLESKNDHRG